MSVESFREESEEAERKDECGVVPGGVGEEVGEQNKMHDAVEECEGSRQVRGEDPEEGAGGEVVEVRRHRNREHQRSPREDYLRLHLPFRVWCPLCVHTSGIHDHRSVHTTQSADLVGITISMDSCFQGNSQEEEEEEENTVDHGNQTVLILPIDGTWALQEFENTLWIGYCRRSRRQGTWGQISC